jgi:hypothetical protein
VFTKDLTADDLQRLFTRETREAYEFFTRGTDPKAFANLPWHLRLFEHARLLFFAFTLKLTPARRAIYGIALVATVIGLIELLRDVRDDSVGDFLDQHPDWVAPDATAAVSPSASPAASSIS